MAEHRYTIEQLTTLLRSCPSTERSTAISSDGEVMESDVTPVKPTIRDVGIQCG